VEGTDRRGLLSDIAKAITNTGTNIQSASTDAVEGGMHGEFVIEIEDLTHLTKVMKAVRKVKGVINVERREPLAESDLYTETE
jgi:GTP pyrophosphokinase